MLCLIFGLTKNNDQKAAAATVGVNFIHQHACAQLLRVQISKLQKDSHVIRRKKVDQLIVLLNFSWFALYAALKFDEIDPRLARTMDSFKRFQTSGIWNKLPIVDLSHDLLFVDAVKSELPQITEATLNAKKNEVLNLEINKRYLDTALVIFINTSEKTIDYLIIWKIFKSMSCFVLSEIGSPIILVEKQLSNPLRKCSLTLHYSTCLRLSRRVIVSSSSKRCDNNFALLF